MTDLAKAIAFATHCLKWTDVKSVLNARGTLIYREGAKVGFYLDNADEMGLLLEQFLQKKYFIQVNRGYSSLFQWRAIVGLQDLSAKGACWDHAVGVGNNEWDAKFDACVQAAGMFEKPENNAQGT